MANNTNITTTKPITIAGSRLWFENWSTRTNYATTEHSRLMIDYPNIPSICCESVGTSRWINRPWQEWTYQDSQVAAIAPILADRIESSRANYLAMYGLSRMSAKRRADWEARRNNPYNPLWSWHYADSLDDEGFWLAVMCYAKNCGSHYKLQSREWDVLEHLSHVEPVPNADNRPVWKFVSLPDPDTRGRDFFKWDQWRNEFSC